MDEKDQKFEYDADFKGPIADRKCTDIFCCLLFLVFWVGMIVVAVMGVMYGNPARLVYPQDYQNNTCGIDNTVFRNASQGGVDYTSMPYLYVPTIANRNLQLCVAACPSTGSLGADILPYVTGLCDPKKIQCDYANRKLSDAAKETKAQEYPADPASRSCWCPYKTSSVLRRCVPADILSAANSTLKSWAKESGVSVIATSKIYAVLGDFAAVWWWILACCGIAAVLCFIYLFLLKIAAGFMVWTTVFLVVAAFAGLTAYIYISGSQYTAKVKAETPMDPDKAENALIVMIISYVMIGIDVALICIILFFRKRIKLAVQVVKEASAAVRDMPMIIFFPFIIFFVVLGFLAYWVAIALFLVSAKEYNTTTGTFEQSQNLQYATLYHLFGFYWTSNFLIALIMASVAGAISAWYWTFDKDSLQSPVSGAVKRTLRYHTGSLAFGSLILAVVQFARFMLERAEQQMAGKDNKFVKFAMCCLRCCLWCLEKIIRFLNKNAYIMIAVHGYSFCAGARKAFFLIARNILRVAAVNVVGDFLLLLGKLFIVVATGIIAMIYLKDSDEVRYWMMPWILIIVMAYIIANGFMVLYELAIDTILMCFLEDEERNDGSSEKPYHMSDDLREYISLNQKQPDEKE